MIKAKGKYPSKTTINLLPEDRTKKKNTTAVVVFLLFMVGLALFTKFLVIDKINELNDAKREYLDLQAEVEALKEYNADYDEVLDEYNHHGVAYLSNEEIVIQSREKVLDLIDSEINASNGIAEITVKDNVADITMESVTLSDVATVVGALEESEIVQYVLVDTADSNVTDSGDKVDAEIQVTFVDAVEITDNTAELEAEAEALAEEEDEG